SGSRPAPPRLGSARLLSPPRGRLARRAAGNPRRLPIARRPDRTLRRRPASVRRALRLERADGAGGGCRPGRGPGRPPAGSAGGLPLGATPALAHREMEPMIRPKDRGLDYLRRSTDKQEISLPKQLEWAVAAARQHGVALDAAVADLAHMQAL